MAKKRAKRDAASEPAKPKPRRSKGDGGITERADGRFQGTADLGIGPDGKRDRRYVYAKTKTECREKLRKLLEEHRGGRLVDPGRVTTGEYLAEWLAKPGRKWRPTTADGYRRMVEDYLAPRIGRVPLQKLTGANLEWCFEDMTKAGLAGSTQAYAFTVLRLALYAAVRAGLIRSNPCVDVDKDVRPRADSPEVAFLTEDQIRALLAAARGFRLYGYYHVALYSGLRPGEMGGLRRSDVDVARKVISVTRTVSEVRRAFHVGDPKTKKSRRAVTLPDHAVEAYRRHLELIDGEGLGGCELVFPNQVGKFLHRSSIGVQLHKALERAGLPRIRPHDLRHSHASLLLAKGVNPKVVSERLGHASVVITLNRYSHVIAGLQQQAADALNDPFAGAGEP